MAGKAEHGLLNFMHLLPPDCTLKSGKHVAYSVSFTTVKIRGNPQYMLGCVLLELALLL